MNFGGLGTWAALLKEELKKKPCQRCALRYDHKKMISARIVVILIPQA